MDKWCGSSFHQKTLTCFKLPSQKIFLVEWWTSDVINYENGIISWYFDFYLCQNSIFL